jgi:putative tricarboxylic transport membrane protein
MDALGVRIVGAVLLASGLLLGFVAVHELDGAAPAVDGPRFAPIVVTGLWTILAIAYLVRPSTVDGEADPVEPSDVDDPAAAPVEHRWTPVLLVAALVAYAFALEPAGFALASTVFYVGAARILGSRQWVRDLVVAVPLAFGVYLAFTRLLDIRLPEGVLPL